LRNNQAVADTIEQKIRAQAGVVTNAMMAGAEDTAEAAE
jgi:hypothetical protein